MSLTLTIRNARGVIYSGAITNEYLFTPTDYGVYRFIYTATDSSNRKLETTYLVTIKDRISPVLTILGEVPASANFEGTVNLPLASVTDNYDEEVRLWLFVLGPNGELRALKEGELSFIAKLRGEYVITYFAQDSYNNYSSQSFKIIVG